MPGFVHLNVKSAYSLCQSMLTIEQIAALCKEHEAPAVGIADIDNLFGALEISEKLASKGIQPIVGMTVSVDFQDGKPGGRMTLVAMNEHGYRNLLSIACAHAGARYGQS